MTDKKPARVIDQPQGPRGIQVKTEYGHPTTTIIARIYRLIVGFEVNYIGTAFKKTPVGSVQALRRNVFVHDITTDTGHAFFYVTKNDQVVCFFSFGPKVDADVLNAPVATTAYKIKEVTQLFRLRITEKSALGILEAAKKVSAEADAGKLHYRFLTNDTCAETAEDILKNYVSNLPDASGLISIGGNTKKTDAHDKPIDSYMYVHPAKVVNPYMWHHNFIAAGFTPITYPIKALEDAARAANKPYLEIGGETGFEVSFIETGTRKEGWSLDPTDIDPLIEKGYAKRPY